jgi:cytidylate kinase
LDKLIIAIDGQASTGKSTQAKKIADNLGFNYRDSGAYYRAITLYLLNNNVKHDLKISQKILDQINIKQDYNEGHYKIFLNDDDVTNKIRGHKVSLNVSNYAKKPEIRKFVFSQLRKSAESKSIVVDGRDIGTVVFPNADFKFFLIAEPRIRAERRHKQIDDDSIKVDIIEKEIKIRDKTDSTREIAPLRKADDAFKIDVSELTIDEVFNKILQKIKSD